MSFISKLIVCYYCFIFSNYLTLRLGDASECMQKGKKPIWCEMPGVEADDVFELEFEDHDEWNEFYGTFKSHMKLLAQAMTAHFPVLMAQTLGNYLVQLLTATVPTGGSGASACKVLQLELDVFHNIYATLLKDGLESDALETGLTRKGSQSNVTSSSAAAAAAEGGSEEARKAAAAMNATALLNTASAAFVQVLQWRPEDAILLLEQLKMIQYHSPILKRVPSLMGQALSYLFELMQQHYMKWQQCQDGGAAADGAFSFDVVSKIPLCLSAVTKFCAKEIVQSDFFQDFLEKVLYLLKCEY